MEIIRASAAAGILACLWKKYPSATCGGKQSLHIIMSVSVLFWPSRTWKCLGAPEVPHVRIFVWNFPSCSRQLFHILSACLLSGFTRTTRVRGAQPCGAAQVHPSSLFYPPHPPFLTLGKLWTEVRLPPDAAASKRKNKMFKQRRLESSPGYFYVTRPSSVLAVAFASQQSSGSNFPDAGCVFLVVIWKRKTSLMWTDTQYLAHFIQNGKRSLFTK